MRLLARFGLHTSADLGHVAGHRQVTDAYLAALAVSQRGRLATFDNALVEALPAQTELIR
jgi:predicted nucleic acid-binding protein